DVHAAVTAALALRSQIEGRRVDDVHVRDRRVAVAALADVDRFIRGDRGDVRACSDLRRAGAQEDDAAAATAPTAAAPIAAAASATPASAAIAAAATTSATAAGRRDAIVEREPMHLVVRRP